MRTLGMVGGEVERNVRREHCGVAMVESEAPVAFDGTLPTPCDLHVAIG